MNKPSEKLILDGTNQSNQVKKVNRCRSFHFRYLELCRSKNVTPLPEVKAKNNGTNVLELFGDKVSVNDWLLIVEALHYDQILQTLCIKTRKVGGVVLDQLDNEKKAKLFKQKPAIYTKFVFSGIIEAVAHCLSINKNLRILHLEGLPLSDIYVETVAKAMATNECLRDVSFARSNLQDDGCETICNTIKYLENVEKVNLSECHLTTKGAEYVADMIKMQKISRYTEGWQKSLRYRDVDPNSIPGLREIYLSRNPGIDDNGVKAICEVLKEDVWIKVIEMEECGLTDLGANCIIDCLAFNNFITDFNVTNNVGISKFLLRNIHEQLGKEDEEQKALVEHQQYLNGVTSANLGTKKITLSQLRDRLKFLEDQLDFERVLRKKAEQLNERLNQQIITYENQIENAINSKIPEGFVVVRNEALQQIIKERNELQDLVHNTQVETKEHKHMNTSRSGHQSEDSGDQTHTLRTLPLINFYEASQEESAEEDHTQRKTARIRKIRSEMVQMEVMPAANPKEKPEARSDNEFVNDKETTMPTSNNYENYYGNENGYQNGLRKSPKSKGEKTNVTASMNEFVEEKSEPETTRGQHGFGDFQNSDAGENDKTNSFIYNNEEYFEDESIKTDTSDTVESLETNSMRSTDIMQSMKVFIKPKPNKPKANPNQNINYKQYQQLEIGQGDGGDLAVDMDMIDIINKSPRSLFFGMYED